MVYRKAPGNEATAGTTRNDGGFKILWLLVLFVLGVLGLVAYLVLGRKDLK